MERHQADLSNIDEEKGEDETEDKVTEELTVGGKFVAFFNAPKVTFITHTVIWN